MTSPIVKDKDERIKHIFQFMEYGELSEKQLDLVISFEDYWKKRDFLTESQYEILEDIFKQAAEKA